MKTSQKDKLKNNAVAAFLQKPSRCGLFFFRQALAVALFASAIAGCARHYRITLTNNNVITTTSRPKLDEATSTYRYKDSLGRPASMPAFRIKTIEPQ